MTAQRSALAAVAARLCVGVLVLLGAGSAGCSEVIGLSDKVYDREPSGAGGGNGASGAAGGGGVGAGPPGMVGFDDGNGQVSFIDAREVTVGEYAAWLAEGAAPSLGGTRCAGNHSLVPLEASVPGTSTNCFVDGVDWAEDQVYPDRPVRCIDWCDAAEYCSQHDKRLCGRVGGGTVATHYDVAAFVIDEPRSSAWYMACSRADTRVYPYGGVYSATACNGVTGAVEAVGSRSTCQGGYDGLFDMSGNLEEWEDACDPPEGDATAACMRRGGAYYTAQFNPTSWLACGAILPEARGNMGTSTGFRCCSDP